MKRIDVNRLGTEFSELHERASKRFGFNWYKLNEILVHQAMADGVDYTDPRMKLFLSRCALLICRSMPQHYALPDFRELEGEDAP